MRTHTDSQIVTWNEDGSRTVETTETIYPLTPGQTAKAWGVLVTLAVIPLTPILAIAAYEKFEEKKAERRKKKALKSVK